MTRVFAKNFADDLIVDTRDESCPIRIAYHFGGDIQDGVRENELVSYALARLLPRVRPIAVIRGTEFSARTSDLRSSAAYTALSEHARELGLFQVLGAGGYRALAYDALLGPIPHSQALRGILARLQRRSGRPPLPQDS